MKKPCNCEKKSDNETVKNVYITNIFYPPFYSEGALLFCVFLPVLVFVQDEKNLPRCVLIVLSVKVLDFLLYEESPCFILIY